MGKRLIIVFIFAAVLAVGVFYLTTMVQSTRPQPVTASAPVQQAPVVQTVQVAVAAKDLPTGTIVQANGLTFRDWPASGIDRESYVVSDSSSLKDYEGAVVRNGMRAGEPLIKSNLIKRGESGFMAAVLRPGYRAVSLSVTPNTGVAGFVFPGDRVDIVLSHIVQMAGETSAQTPHNVSETVLHNVRVIAIDQRVSDQEQVPAVGNIVTVEVLPQEAERISVAQRIGELRLLLRPLADAAQGDESSSVDGRTFTFDSDLSQIIAPPVGSFNGGSHIEIIRGSGSSSGSAQ